MLRAPSAKDSGTDTKARRMKFGCSITFVIMSVLSRFWREQMLTKLSSARSVHLYLDSVQNGGLYRDYCSVNMVILKFWWRSRDIHMSLMWLIVFNIHPQFVIFFIWILLCISLYLWITHYAPPNVKISVQI